MASVALLSNPRSTGNLSMLPRMRSYCAAHSDVFHYEVESIEQIGEALRTIARVNPKVLVVNGGDGTVQAALTELYLGNHFDGSPPPVAVLPNGKTNLIALDLGAVGDPIAALARVIEIARNGIEEHVVVRELIALSDGTDGARPVLGMFLGGAGLADTILYCRNKIYPLGLPNGISHILTAIAVMATLILGIRTAFLPPAATPLKVSMMRQGQLHGRFSLLIVTTLHKLLLGSSTAGSATAGALQLMVVEQRPIPLLRAIFAGIFGRVGRNQMDGVHFERGDEIRIEGDRSSVVLDGEIFQADPGRPIILKTTPPVPFLRLAA
ncbi:diacylglycerol/lipid kinase family protein [Sphingomonas sp. SRS2]|uniref:diacylglycerol/lipid kinase family protein n=1 Tax=Sphingomonas sp. SRS2 TaxID=133190 RepID=UPI0006184C4C|nr:diacylglycerol kinase family protein [Sphingomonas sp. SRS2]KKC26738.1 diacylglycerol kinase [Sphingomonas sp. SRS2]